MLISFFFFYLYWYPLNRSKGETEERLASLGYSDTIIARPGVLLERQEYRPLAAVAV